MDRQVVDLMIDFETLGVSRDSVVLSVGMIVWNDDVYAEYYQEFDVRFQLLEGRTVDKSTLEWWNKENPDEFTRLLFGVGPNIYECDSFLRFLEEHKIRHIYSKGHLDFEILQDIVGNFFDHWQHRDVRTLTLFKKCPKGNHNALDDCKVQLKFTKEVLDEMSRVRGRDRDEVQVSRVPMGEDRPLSKSLEKY